MPKFTWRTNTRQRLSLSFPELRCSLAVTAKKCTKKAWCRCRAIVLPVWAYCLFCRSRWRRRRRCLRAQEEANPVFGLASPTDKMGLFHDPRTPPRPAPPPTRDYRQTKIWFYRQFCNRGKLDQESWSPVLGIFSTWNSTIHSNFLQLVTPSLLVERRSTKFGVCGTKALN